MREKFAYLSPMIYHQNSNETDSDELYPIRLKLREIEWDNEVKTSSHANDFGIQMMVLYSE